MNYYGVRYAHDCHPDEFWVKYFTTSNYVAEYRKEHGEPDVIEIRKQFLTENSVDDAREWEHRVLKKLDVVKRNDYLNMSDGKGIDPRVASAARKGVSPGNKNLPQAEHIKAKKRKPKEVVVCPHCGKSGGISAMYRHHFNNCGKKMDTSVIVKLREANEKKAQRPLVKEIYEIRSSLSQNKLRAMNKIIKLKPGWYQLPDDTLVTILSQYKELTCRP
jgi:ssDNA-binding Zn-finger/Zn-ribbon topoisomerase 1